MNDSPLPPLVKAVFDEDVNAVRLLLKQGAAIHEPDDNQATAW